MEILNWTIEEVQRSLPAVPTNADIERVEDLFLSEFGVCPEVCPLEHRFAPGVYMREVVMWDGAFVIGHEHRTEHFNIVLAGEACVLIDGKVKWVHGGDSFVSKPGVRKILMITEETRWATVHANPDDERDIDKIEARTIIKSPTYLRHEQEALLNCAQSSIASLL